MLYNKQTPNFKSKMPISIDVMKNLWVWIITVFLYFIVFQRALIKTNAIWKPLAFIDEIFILILIAVSILIVILRRKCNKVALPILAVLGAMSLIGIVSKVCNGNGVLVTLAGIFDYIKYFLAIPTLSIIGCDKKDLYVLSRRLFILVCVLSVIAILQEVSYLAGFYEGGIQRCGLLRTPSLMGHPNTFGLYCLLLFILSFYQKGKLTWANFLMVVGIHLSISRMAWAGFLAVFTLITIELRAKRNVLLLVISVVLFCAMISSSGRHTLKEMLRSKTPDIETSNYREYCLNKSIEIWGDNKFFGVGLGKFGGVVSVRFKSEVYEKYDFSQKWFDYGLKRFGSLDQFWAQCLVELGLVGLFTILLLLFVLGLVPRQKAKSCNDKFTKKTLKALSYFPIVIFLYMFGSGLNLTPILLTYCIFLGIGLGVTNENSINK